MIALDNRAGSGDLIQYLPKTKTQLTRLAFGDAAFIGRGPGGDLVPVGVEVKTVPDCLKCIQDGRFAGHQLPGLRQEYVVCYLVLEGSYRGHPKSGELQLPKGTRWVKACHGRRVLSLSDFERWLISMELLGGIRIRQTRTRKQTADFIYALYRWWEKEWEEHDSLSVYDMSGFAPAPSLLRRIVKELPGIGWKRSREVERHFQSMHNLWNAGIEDWKKIPGIGKKISEEVWNALHVH